MNQNDKNNLNEAEKEERMDSQEKEASVSGAEETADPGTENTPSTPPENSAEKTESKRPKKKKKSFAKLHSRAFKRGGLSILLVCLFIAGVVVINLISNVLVEKIPALSIDMTGTAMNELSQDTIDFITTLDKDVEIMVLATESDYVAANQYFLQANSLLKQYHNYNNRITIDYVDLAANPTFTGNYPDETLAAGDYIVQCGDNYRLLTTEDLFNMTYDQTTYSQVVESSNVEPAVTTAILNVTSEDQTKVAFVNGFGDYDADAYKKLLENNNYEVVETSLLTDDIDSEAPIAVLFAPTVDLDSTSIQKLSDYLSNGGNYGKTLIYVAAQSRTETPLLDSFLEEWGMALGDGYLAETDAQYLPVSNNPYLSIFDFANDDFTAGLKNASIPLVGAYSKPVTILDEANVTPLFTTSENSGLIPFDADENFDFEGAIDGKYNAGAISTHKGDGADSSIIAIGSVAMFNSQFLSSSTFNNAEYFINMANIQSGNEEEGITIAPKDISLQELGIMSAQAMTIGTVFMVVIPVIVLIFGIVLWLRRRNR